MNLLSTAARTVLSEATANEKKLEAVMEQLRKAVAPLPNVGFTITKGSGGYFLHDGDGNTWQLEGKKQ